MLFASPTYRIYCIPYCSCIFEHKLLVTDFFLRTALGNKERSWVACILEGDDDENLPSKLTRSVVIIGDPFYVRNTLFLRDD